MASTDNQKSAQKRADMKAFKILGGIAAVFVMFLLMALVRERVEGKVEKKPETDKVTEQLMHKHFVELLRPDSSAATDSGAVK
jgi:hypothetical protein